jgi:RNA polymerase sigma-70 factor (ECF subfamily)
VEEGRTKHLATNRMRDWRNAARACRGDVAAFSRLVEAHSGLVRSVALRLLGAEDAPDATEEVWIRAWRNLRSFRGDSAFSTWLYSVATNSCLAMRRNRTRRKEWERGEDWMIFLSEPSGGEADPEAATLNSERSREVEAALGRVRVDHRAALVLRHMEGRSYAEIAEVLGVPVGTAKGWVSRGRDALLVSLTE